MARTREDEDSDLYSVLNLDKNASIAEVRESHRRLSRIFHPDKHASIEAKLKADPRFQALQHAYEVLSNERTKAIYDTLGEEGLSLKMEVGQRNMTPDELRQFWQNKVHQMKVDEVEALVHSRSDISVSVDARSLFGPRVVRKTQVRFGVPYNIDRPATFEERLNDTGVRAMVLRSSWNIPFIFPSVTTGSSIVPETREAQEAKGPSQFTITGQATAGKKGKGAYNVIGLLRHSFNSQSQIELSLPLLSPREFFTKFLYQPSPTSFYTIETSTNTFLLPPQLVLTAGRQITDRSVLFSTLRSGPWKLAGWGDYGNASQYIIGWTRNAIPADPSGYTVELITGLQVLGVATDYNTFFESSGIRVKAGGSITTGGLSFTFGANRKVSDNTRLGASVSAGPTSLIVRLNISRLGQKLSLPIFIGDGPELPALLYGVVLPFFGLVAFEFGYVIPRRERQRKLKIAEKKLRINDKLEKQEKVARDSVELMAETISRRQDAAKESGGLCITEATYGTATKRVDVTIATAALVNENQLILARDQRKCNLIGFWDVEYSEKKTLRIDYEFGGRKHFVEVGDKDALTIPFKSHML